ncbi:MAG TPA: phosphoribosylglycinamide synthetase C domain-containing protein, partial [Flavisolibacter sp.]|nr:phosphoribosylglycinamide synthetase C domain-containing protein [Flavisolibacter sp.]
PFADETFMKKVVSKIIEPTIKGLQENNLAYKGFVFIGVIKCKDEPFVIEYNCRMGDPETEVVLPRIKNDLVQILAATAKGNIGDITIDTDDRFAATIVAVSGGYPNAYEKGFRITGLQQQPEDNIHVFHSATKQQGDDIVTNGGRVFCVSALADTLQVATETCIEVVESINFEDKYYRRDIGYEFQT